MVDALVLLYFHNLVTRVIQGGGGDITVYKRMLLAALRFPVTEIAQEVLLFLSVALS